MRITNLKPRNKYIPRRVGLVWCVDILRMHTALLIIFNNPFSWELRLVPRYSYNHPCFPLGSTPIYLHFPVGSTPYILAFPLCLSSIPIPYHQGLPTPEDASASRWRQVQRRNISLKLFLPSMFSFQNNRKGYIKHKVNVIQGKRVQQKGKKKNRAKKVKKSTWLTDPVM